MNPIPVKTRAWVRSTLGPGARILRVEPMPEASHTNHRLLVETAAGGVLDAVLRRYTDGELRGTDPWYDPRAELETMGVLAAIDAPVPRLIAEDVEARECDVPTLLVTRLPGSPPVHVEPRDAFVRRLAEPLPGLHAAATPEGFRTYEPYYRSDGLTEADLRVPPWARDEAVWERLFEVAAGDAPDHAPRFIHRDYHHGNTMWVDGRLTGIIDWTTGCSGPAGIDLAQMRINLAWEFDQELADAFREAWLAEAGDTGDDHPYWDLLDAADWLGDGSEEDASHTRERLDRYEAFVARALAELG